MASVGAVEVVKIVIFGLKMAGFEGGGDHPKNDEFSSILSYFRRSPKMPQKSNQIL